MPCQQPDGELAQQTLSSDELLDGPLVQGQVDVVSNPIRLRVCHGPGEGTQHQAYQCIGLPIAEAGSFPRRCWEVSVGRQRQEFDTFQIVLISEGNGNFDIEYRYNNIQWTTGDASGGANGLNGTSARAGYSAGDDSNLAD